MRSTRRDRTGETLDDERDDGACPARCRGGWIAHPETSDRPRACLHCRPWLRGIPRASSTPAPPEPPRLDDVWPPRDDRAA